MTTRTNRDLAKELKGQRGARFCLCDFHVHSPASHDVISNPDLGEIEKERLGAFIGKPPKDWAKHQQDVLKAYPPTEYLSHLTQQRDDVVTKLGIGEYNKWAIVAITDHNVCSYATELAHAAWSARKTNRLIVLPGIELDVEFPISANETVAIHVLCIFSPSVKGSDIRIAIREASSINWEEGNQSLKVDSLLKFVGALRSHKDYPAMVIAAHIASRKGVQSEVKRLLTAKEAEIAQLEAELALADASQSDIQRLQEQISKLKPDGQEANIDISVLKTIGQCGFDALQVGSKSDEKHYRRLHRFRVGYGRSVPIVSSDAHSLSKIFHVAGELYPQLKLSNSFDKLIDENSLFTEVRDHAIRCGETRFSYTYGGEVTHWIEGIEVVRDSESAANFWPNSNGLVLPFSRNLNCLIGGRGSGKSAIIEALSFLLNPAEAQKHGLQTKRDEWYGRASSTLSGCKLRLCWRAIGDEVDHEFYKGVFLTRYFDPNNRHIEPSVTNIEGGTLLLPTLPPVQIYRFHDIEKAAEPDGLRKLIDDVAGGIDEIEVHINSIRTELSNKSATLFVGAMAINELTKDGAPLRCYTKRKLDYARVNKKEVELHFIKLDSIEAAGKSLKQLREQWDQISDQFSPGDLNELENLMLNVSAAISSKDKEYLQGLSQLINGNDAPLLKFIATLRDLTSWQKKTGEGFDKQRSNIKEQFIALRDELEQQGLPMGSKDREAKKKELDESIDALKEYREKIQEFDKIYDERVVLFEKLKTACSERTDLRVSTAERITNQLRQDLDETILKIEASAQPIADKSEFEVWLKNHISVVFGRYKNERIASLLDGGLTPEILRDILLNKRNDCANTLVRNHGKASDGNVSDDEANSIRAMEAISKYEPEVSPNNSEIDPTIYAELPTEIREGLRNFPIIGGTLQLKAVLALDEIVFNDVPIVCLNDRPQESGSTLRPLHELSPGQRCSAVLPILLLNGRSPLIIDQPEDNLDNRLIRQVIVNVLGSIKLRRQVIVATHNPNIPVLGDAEQTIVLAAIDEKQSQVKAHGNLDEWRIVSAVTEIMEGGREAFQYRQSIYQAHWDGAVAQE